MIAEPDEASNDAKASERDADAVELLVDRRHTAPLGAD